MKKQPSVARQMKKAAKIYGSYDNFFILEKEVKEAGKLQKCRRKYNRIIEAANRAVSLMELSLREDKGNEGLNIEPIVRSLSEEKEKSAKELTYDELSRTGAAITLAALALLFESGDNPELFDRLISVLRFTGEIDHENLLSHLSDAEMLLLSYEPFYESDEKTRQLCRENIRDRAKKNKIPESAAAKLLIDENTLFVPERRISKYYFPLMYTLTAAFTLLSALPLGYILPIFLIIPFSEISKQLCDRMFSRIAKPKPIPRIDKKFIGDDAKTVIVFTTLLCSEKDGIEICKKLKDAYYSNREENLRFGILADLCDSKTEENADDSRIIDSTKREIDRLNHEIGEKFFLFTRKRSFSESEGRYIGWERKRGAVISLANLICRKQTQLEVYGADSEFLYKAKFVITLDSDTRLYFGAASEMICAMLHPANKPEIKDGRVVSGYGIMQPKTEPTLSSASRTPFSVLLSGASGTDLYSFASYETYQTLFKEGIFCGKGIFDVRLFSMLIPDAFPENTILSHDLLEGEILRCGALTDMTLNDNTPKNPLAFYKRAHRWVRGDIQSLRYAFSKAPSKDQKKAKNPLSGLSRYKIFDNLRRALLKPSSLICMIISVFMSRKIGAITIILTLLPYFVPLFLSLFSLLRTARRRFCSFTLPGAISASAHALYEIASLPFAALNDTDAVIRASVRGYITHKKTLEWVTASDADSRMYGIWLYLKKMLLSMLVGLFFVVFSKGAGYRLLGLLWVFFPIIAFRLGIEFNRFRSITRTEKALACKYAFDQWHFFAEQVGESDSWLPPDNIQLAPTEEIAHRTSPTNIGLYLLSCLAAKDLGFISEKELKDRLKNAFESIKKLPKWQGHLYNWYDTKSLDILGAPYVSTVDSGNFVTCLIALAEGLEEFKDSDAEISSLADEARRLASVDFSPLYNEKRQLFSVGINLNDKKAGDGCYDIFMSEVRTTSYYAIAKGDVPKEHFKRLARPLICRSGRIGLASWTGTMFEYFMPALLLPVKRGSVSNEALRFCISSQARAQVKGVFGRSESGYFAFDSRMRYQYKAFGDPFLGIKKGLEKELVISPYSSFLILPFSPSRALDNLERLKKLGAYGKYGFYEAVDFTPSRVGGGNAIIRSYMSHHVGMSIVATANACLDGIFVKRFMRNPIVKSASELLDERIPVDTPIKKRSKSKGYPQREDPLRGATARGQERSQSEPHPAGIISGGVLRIVTKGSLISLYDGDRALITDPFAFGREHRLRLLFKADGKVFDALSGGSSSHGIGSVAEYRLATGSLKAKTDISLSGKYRAVCISLEISGAFKEICPMLFFEPSMAETESRLAHSAYSDLSIEAEYLPEHGILLYRRRRRSEKEKECYLAVTFESHGENASFAIRKDEILHPMYSESDIYSLFEKNFPSNGGACILPVCAMKKASVTDTGKYRCDFLIASGSRKDEVLSVIGAIRKELHRFRRKPAYRVISESLLPITEERISFCGGSEVKRFVSLMLSCICRGERSGGNELTEPASIEELWSLSVSGDNPIFCIDITAKDFAKGDLNYRMVCGFVFAKKYLDFSGVPCDLVIICHDKGDYHSKKMRLVKEAVSSCGAEYLLFRSNGIFVFDEPVRIDLIKAASVMTAELDGEKTFDMLFAKYLLPKKEQPKIITEIKDDIEFISGDTRLVKYGKSAFTDRGFEIIKPGQSLHWSNVYVGKALGTLVTQYSLGYTWYENSHERRITPFDPDPLLGFSGERLILSENGKSYDLTACASSVLFGKGCAVYDGVAGGIVYTVKVGVSLRLPVKAIYITLSKAAKVDYLVKPVMGDRLKFPKAIMKTESGNTVFYKNMLKNDLEGFCAFKIFLSDKSEKSEISGKNEYGFLLGACPEKGKTIEFIKQCFKTPADILPIFSEYAEHYKKLFSFRLSSKIKELDLLINYYIPYQTLACRMLARTGFSQSSGAYGFRDQLQDCLAIMKFDPKKARVHILRAACHQFPEGDVLHWWHESRSGARGVRTLCSDDYLWLPFTVAKYIKQTGDSAILDIKLPYLDSPPLKDKESERYEKPSRSHAKETLYMHCVRAIDHGLSFGKHGLPYMGSCDWNDGMSAIGEGGGESIWLGFFLILTIRSFLTITDGLKDESAARYRDVLKTLRASLEKCFEKDRYLRAFFADGTAVGAPGAPECEIDILPQAFAALTAETDEEKRRAKTALMTATHLLFDEKHNIYKLFTPPFSGIGKYPGYIAGYVPGVRENGGQYTHGAIWGAIGLLEAGYAEAGARVLLSLAPTNAAKKPFYKAEPYYFCGDVYSSAGLEGRGGWSLYTGAAGWYFNAVVEHLLGIKEQKNGFILQPRLSRLFSGFSFRFSRGQSEFLIVARLGNKYSCTMDGSEHDNFFLYDKNSHLIEITVECKNKDKPGEVENPEKPKKTEKNEKSD